MGTISGLAKEDSHAQSVAHPGAVLRDCLFLALVGLVSFILHVSKLGFYSDDWVFFSLLQLADDQSLPGLYQALYAGDVVIRQRPVQMVYLVIFYWLFGLNPLFYHLANATALIASGILFYLIIREFGRSRVLALAIPLVYLLLPHYSTDRFWVAAHQATFSIFFYFISLYADVRAAREYPRNLVRWKLLSVAGLVLSGLAYEVALPLFILNPLIAWYSAHETRGRETGQKPNWIKFTSLFAANLLALLIIVGFKALVTVRTNVETDLISHLIYLFTGALRVNFGTYGLGLPYIVGWILLHELNWLLLAGSGLVGLFIFRYLFGITGQPVNEFSRKKTWLILPLLGLLVFGSGYAIFAFNADIWFTSASLGNRVAIAAAIGVAITFVGFIGWGSSHIPRKSWSKGFFCLCISLLSATGFLINNTLATFWITAYAGQQRILDEIRDNVPALPAGSTFILDGVCLEQGGAYLFTGKRDLAATLMMAYGDPSLKATVISSSPQIGERGISILTYNSNDSYPYGESLYIYNYSQKKLYSLVDAEIARRYFQGTGFVPEENCPPGFAWGWNDK